METQLPDHSIAIMSTTPLPTTPVACPPPLAGRKRKGMLTDLGRAAKHVCSKSLKSPTVASLFKSIIKKVYLVKLKDANHYDPDDVEAFLEVKKRLTPSLSKEELASMRERYSKALFTPFAYDNFEDAMAERLPVIDMKVLAAVRLIKGPAVPSLNIFADKEGYRAHLAAEKKVRQEALAAKKEADLAEARRFAQQQQQQQGEEAALQERELAAAHQQLVADHEVREATAAHLVAAIQQGLSFEQLPSDWQQLNPIELLSNAWRDASSSIAGIQPSDLADVGRVEHFGVYWMLPAQNAMLMVRIKQEAPELLLGTGWDLSVMDRLHYMLGDEQGEACRWLEKKVADICGCLREAHREVEDTIMQIDDEETFVSSTSTEEEDLSSSTSSNETALSVPDSCPSPQNISNTLPRTMEEDEPSPPVAAPKKSLLALTWPSESVATIEVSRQAKPKTPTHRNPFSTNSDKDSEAKDDRNIDDDANNTDENASDIKEAADHVDEDADNTDENADDTEEEDAEDDASAPSIEIHLGEQDASVQQICRHFLKGNCKFGSRCPNKHEPSKAPTTTTTTTTSASPPKDASPVDEDHQQQRQNLFERMCKFDSRPCGCRNHKTGRCGFKHTLALLNPPASEDEDISVKGSSAQLPLTISSSAQDSEDTEQEVSQEDRSTPDRELDQVQHKSSPLNVHTSAQNAHLLAAIRQNVHKALVNKAQSSRKSGPGFKVRGRGEKGLVTGVASLKNIVARNKVDNSNCRTRKPGPGSNLASRITK
ncbi:hypothetical protein K458DRAFT_192640 [Lentithecium fluviatile CBS 122367]|uniref:C3H1-type domain-containing protein n=1 Tax=Lentithecium fluviatile CBS 122367 TaxID=1168545 RepID=A0A6G1ID70_9PLEO|nr:hypothetical protein K458DRAFT_192640 [Lentithecium fluviatile CBS 122367]